MENPRRPHEAGVLVLGLLGGVGAGKSTVASLLGGLGATVLDADREAREALDLPAARAALAARFGPEVQRPDGSIDRGRLGARLFAPGGEDDRRFVERLIHPVVRERLAAGLDRARRAGGGRRLVVLDVPLLLEGPLAAWCDRLVFVDAPEEIRRARAATRHGWSAEEHARREATQIGLSVKRASADHVITNDGSLDELQEKVRALADELAPTDIPAREAASAPSRPGTQQG